MAASMSLRPGANLSASPYVFALPAEAGGGYALKPR